MSFRRCELMEVRNIFYHPDYTVGIRFNHIRLADYHRRSGITPCPEDISIQLFNYCLHYSTVPGDCKYFFQERFDRRFFDAYNGDHH